MGAVRRPSGISILRFRLKHARSVAFGVEERDILAHHRYLHWITEYLATGLSHISHRGLNVINRNDDGRVLRRPVGLLREEAAIDRTGLLWAVAFVRFSCPGKNIVAHILAKRLRLPTKSALIELRHALAVVVRHFEVNNRTHLGHDHSP